MRIGRRVVEFRNDDAGYLAWVSTNRGGFVLKTLGATPIRNTLFFIVRSATASRTLGDHLAHTREGTIGRYAQRVWRS